LNILFVGDVVGKPGRRVLLSNLADLREHYNLDFIVVNAENAAAGFGVTAALAEELFENGVDVLTSGNHIWDKREALEYIGTQSRLLRPHNYPDSIPGSGWLVVDSEIGVPVAVLNLMGQVFMYPSLDCPFRCADAVLAEKPEHVKVVLVDFHAEASSEKVAMGWHLDGRVSAVVGSHTHVPTADERVLPQGTAYISDAGMTGCYDSIIGMNTDKVLMRFVHKLPERFEVASGQGTLSAVVIDVDPATGLSRGIERLSIGEWEGEALPAQRLSSA
jgi:metallophosphoesterase (TIGR00282 family)